MDDWTHSFCLACDKQVHTASDAYCSESCRLADFEKTSTPNSQASSPGFTPPGYPWTTRSASNAGFFLSPAYDFTNAKPYGNASVQHQSSKPTGTEQPTRVLTPSSSHSSLCSMQSTSTTGEPGQLSDKTRQELRAYAVSFEQVRLQRRRSY